ncbi:hypothetical protein PMZ80_000680 [Knufia obscura]|uniref:Major facilitator superfamily (MFS) profile domain-containing protein n=1 Tax=Knufia obscura TaxID=1635080 RepID=A0ABR0S1I0_9EURO|nr:hypothetical protein PMZ80_000680 [Knufia obscura]
MAAFRDTPVTHAFRLLGMKNSFAFPEEKSDFERPTQKSFHGWQKGLNTPSTSSMSGSSSDESEVKTEKILANASNGTPNLRIAALSEEAREEHILVDWYDANDAANPRNWSKMKKIWSAGIVCWFTFVVYCASAIFVPADTFVGMRYGTSHELTSLSLAMYVLGYGIGPMLFSPVSEIAYIGRNPPYLVSFVCFLVISVITAVVANKSFAALIVMRFLQGFFGSPILASGGASLDDIYDSDSLPYAYVFWIAAMYCGPALGPVISAYAVMDDWRWPLWEILIMSGPLLVCLPLLPETSAPKILYKRAVRLRHATGDPRYKSKAELVKLDTTGIFIDALIKPIEIAIKDPVIAFVCVYGSLLYATYYSFFEAFPIVYAGVYGLSLQSIALVFTSVVVGCAIFGSTYTAYLYFIYGPQSKRQEMTLESRLRAALPAVFLLPASLFLFAWTSRADVHWIVPTVGIMLYSGTSFVIFQCIVCYVPLTYPKYVASLFAGNDFCRSCLAAGFVMFSRAMYMQLGIAKGVTLLAGLSVMGILGMFYLYFYGANLRAKSKFAVG